MTRIIQRTVPLVTIALMVISVSASLSAMAGEPKSSDQTGDIVEVAAAAGDFKTLAAALEAANLTTTLKGNGPFTVFAPTDEAFANLPEGTVDSLLKPENRDQLVAILTYHVVPGKVMAADVVEISKAKTVNGADLGIKVVEGKVKINEATVVATDVDASNGVIHVVDTVILPL